VRVVGNQAALYVNGVKKAGPVTIDPAHVGLHRHGVHAQTQDPAGVFTRPYSAKLIDYADVRPLPAGFVIPATTRPAVAGAATAVEQAAVASGTAVLIPVPAGVVVGELLGAVFYTDGGGSHVTPAGWTLISTSPATAGVGKISHFERIADGTEGATQTFTKSGGGSSIAAGTMFRVTNYNTVKHFAAGGGAQANAVADTALPAPALNVIGLKKLGLWAGAISANDTLTVPAGWTKLVETSDTGAQAVDLLVATRNYDAAPFISGATTAVGTIGTARKSAALHGYYHPNP
jgi:hypothetical protein